MFVGVVVENFHRCRAEQEKEERAARAAKRAKKLEERRRSELDIFDIHVDVTYLNDSALLSSLFRNVGTSVLHQLLTDPCDGA